MLTILGQSGGPTELSANDDQFGVMTQVPTSGVHHSAAGLDDADGNTGFGAIFQLVCRFAQTTSGTTTVTLCSSNAPYKFRIVSAEIECLQDARKRTERGVGRCSVNILAGSTNTVGSEVATGMRKGDKRNLEINTLGNEIIAADGSLSCVCDSLLPVIATTTTWELLVTLNCLRVV